MLILNSNEILLFLSKCSNDTITSVRFIFTFTKTVVNFKMNFNIFHLKIETFQVLLASIAQASSWSPSKDGSGLLLLMGLSFFKHSSASFILEVILLNNFESQRDSSRKILKLDNQNEV